MLSSSPESLEVVEQPADLVRRCARGTPAKPPEARRERCWSSDEVVPRLDTRRARRELGVRRDDAELRAAARTARCARSRPSPRRTGRGTSRCHSGGAWCGAWRRAEGAGRGRTACPASTDALVADELDRVVGEVLAEVVAVLGRPRRRRPSGCRGRARARTGGSRRRGSRSSGRTRGRAATGRTGRPREISSIGREVPLADRERRVAVRRAGSRRASPRSREMRAAYARDSPCRSSATHRHADRVVVAAGEQAGARRRAERAWCGSSCSARRRPRGGRCSASSMSEP